MADDRRMDRRSFLKAVTRAVGAIGLGVGVGAVAAKGERDDLVWQIDPEKCIACGNCATACVLTPSAARVVHDVEICGFCDFCFGYFAEVRPGDEETAENLRCPTDAIIRNFVEEPYYEYLIDEPKCIGCAICVEGCRQYGNGSLVMQVRHNRCVDCNECAIAAVCPADAFVRVPASEPYLLPSMKFADEEEAETEEPGAPPTPQAQPSQPDPTRPSPLETPPPDREFPGEGMLSPGDGGPSSAPPMGEGGGPPDDDPGFMLL
ncbi:MAG: 4Fe-4S binding protein [Armatimonadota bacterium]|jgi:electron transport complex protein RnfB